MRGRGTLQAGDRTDLRCRVFAPTRSTSKAANDQKERGKGQERCKAFLRRHDNASEDSAVMLSNGQNGELPQAVKNSVRRTLHSSCDAVTVRRKAVQENCKTVKEKGCCWLQQVRAAKPASGPLVAMVIH